MSKKAFNVGDMVFAKVKGYPAWPAKVVAVNGKKYEVDFYGTGEKGMIKVEDLFYYLKHKEQFCKNLKRKDYIEAVEQIEAEIKESGTDGNSKGNEEDPAEEVQEKQEKGKGRKRKRSNSNNEGKKLSHSSNDSLVIEESENSLLDDSTNENDSKISLPAVSRSGRVIKTKRYSLQSEDEEKRATKRRRSMPEGNQISAEGGKSPKLEAINEEKNDVEKTTKIEAEIEEKLNDDEENNENKTKIDENKDVKEMKEEKEEKALKSEPVEVRIITPQYLQTIISYAEHVKANEKRYKGLKEEPRECFENEVVLATLPSGNLVGIKYGTNTSKHSSEYDRALSDEEEAKTLLSLKDLVENGNCKPEDDPNMFILNVEPPDDEQDSKAMEMTNNKIRLLKTEASLVDYDGKIKTSLDLEKAEPKIALEYLDLMSELNITPVMLKKYPAVVDMMNLLTKYVGNAKEWKLTGQDLEIFQKDAEKIRNKAKEIILKFKVLFSVPEKSSFLTVFNRSLEVFKEETKDLKENEVFALCAEPYSRQTFFDNHTLKLDIDSPQKEETVSEQDNCSNKPTTDKEEEKNDVE
ncbi:hepatoma-derived growth factor-related protein 2 [Onthophagus taurus]|uniref:hepatoma-derived growth factor-related protein 2 n=1 Tax=Onthophagus taurus TaxID=166361 RepID=UPI0039BE7EA7